MIRYADYFDVSLDYIFGRTDKPQGQLYEGKMKIEKVYPDMDKFIEMWPEFSFDGRPALRAMASIFIL